MKILKALLYVLIIGLLSCKSQQIQSSVEPKNETEQNISTTGFTSYVLKFYKRETNDSISIFKKKEHIGSTYKKRKQNIDYPEHTLNCVFYKKHKKVDSIQFQNPLYQRYEVFTDNKFKSGLITQDSSSFMIRTSLLNIDSLVITSKNNKRIVLHD